MKIWDRESKTCINQTEPKQGFIYFLYKTIPGRILLKAVIIQPWFLRLTSAWYDSRLSVSGIASFIRKYHIDLSKCGRKNFTSFNDFFTRKELRTSCSEPEELIACTDAKLTVSNITENLRLKIKGSVYTVTDLLENSKAAAKYAGGICLVFRLSLTDYHRYVYPDDGEIMGKKRIRGVFHTVRPIASQEHVFIRNTREVMCLNTRHFGEIIQTEVGAMFVGRLFNHKSHGTFTKMEEKGYFAYGGSTIIQLFKKGALIPDSDILEKNAEDMEVQVKLGERIGVSHPCVV